MRLRSFIKPSVALVPATYFIAQEDNSWLERNTIKGIRSVRAMRTVLDILVDYKFSNNIKSTIHTRSAVKLLNLCKENGGVYIKLGQHLAAMVHLLYIFCLII